MLRLEGVSVCFGQNHVLNQVDLSVAAGEVLVLLGPSGCGKSTLLRTIAGLETPSEGQLFWGAQDLTGLPAHQRGFGMMFQDHALVSRSCFVWPFVGSRQRGFWFAYCWLGGRTVSEKGC